jgi:hypothetical protein
MEFTFALARFVGQNPQLKCHLELSDRGPVFRDGPIKAADIENFINV